jgi:hypothetical protein
MDPLANELGVNVNYANPQEHVPEAERNNRVLKECVRAAYHRLPCNCLPRLLVKTLVTESAKKLNFFPAKNGISQYYSPRMILHERNLDYDKHCQLLLEPMSKLIMSLILRIQMPLALLMVFTFATMTMSKEATMFCTCKLVARLPAVESPPTYYSRSSQTSPPPC